MTSNELKNRALEKFFENMNAMQKKAVFHVEGPQLILAGAGSGKTTVLINRIVCMIYFGDAYETEIPDDFSDEQKQFIQDYIDGKTNDIKRLSDIISIDPIRPSNIFAITFTNKAAGELKDRIALRLGERGRQVTASTFHSACARILRHDRNAERLGYTNKFTIYDADDSRHIVRQTMRTLGIDEKLLPPKDVLNMISGAKDAMITPEQYIENAGIDRIEKLVGEIYEHYQATLFLNDAMDFDDLICNTVKLFEENDAVLNHYQDKYKYLMVDEYQDTNHAQYKLVSLLSAKHGNICVVGDDDQSIYGFRGATIENILSFEDEFDCGDAVVRLEQNYRSTQNILTCANVLIANNKLRKGKNLWTDKGNGNKVTIHRSVNEKDEALYVTKIIEDDLKKGMSYKDHVILYRTNVQSNILEQYMYRNNIPYRIYGGLKFYERKEIKDMIAYLTLINNHSDQLRLHRIINVPKRNIGDKTVKDIDRVVLESGKDAIEVLLHAADYSTISKKQRQLTAFAKMIIDFGEYLKNNPLDAIIDEILDKTGYKDMLDSEGLEGETRYENICELKSNIINYMRNAETPTLEGFLQEVSLYTDIDSLDDNSDYVSLMTVHSSKGLEFPVVFVTGMETGIFPSVKCLEEPLDMEEERRLAYVAMTRAKQNLYLTYADERLLYGRHLYNGISIFLKELPSQNFKER